MDGVVKIHGREYKTIALRVKEFRDEYPSAPLLTEILVDDGTRVLIKATIYMDDKAVASGHAEEIRGSSNINKTSALENAETGAIGRALANLGYGGSEFASADEVANAITQQNESATPELPAPVQRLRNLIEADDDKTWLAWSQMNHDQRKWVYTKVLNDSEKEYIKKLEQINDEAN